MAMTSSSSSLQYPECFCAAASYVGFDGSTSPTKALTSKFTSSTALLLYSLYQQACIGPCNIPEPSTWKIVDHSKWASWKQLGNISSTEAMRLFVKILEEEDPGWYSRASNSFVEPVDVQMNHNSKIESIIENGNSYPETKTISVENGSQVGSQDKDVVEGFNSVEMYDQWIEPLVFGQRPRARYEHGAAVIQDKMYIYGGNHNGRYLNDLHVLDLRSWTWSKIEAKARAESTDLSTSVTLAPCAGHSLIPWENKLLSISGHTKDPSECIQGDKQSRLCCVMLTSLEVSRGGQSASLVGTSIVIFGGQDANRTLLNDLHVLDLETMTWDEIDAVGVPPSPRSDHAAAVHAELYLLIFGGGSHATCYNDLHVLDLQAMEWSRPTQLGDIPAPRAGHAGVTVGENWFIVGGGDNKGGVLETVVLNMSTLAWSVVTSVQGRVPVASEGLSLVVSSYNGDDVLVSFGGYNGRYSNEVYVLKPSHKSTLQTKIIENPIQDSVSAVLNATNATRDVESEFEAGQEGKIREIVMDNVNLESTASAPLVSISILFSSIGNLRETSLLAQSQKKKSKDDFISVLKAEKEELELSLGKEKLHTLQLKQELVEAEARNSDLYKELQSARGQLAAEQSRCFKLEVGVAELGQKLQTVGTLHKELELLQRQRDASQQAALNAKQRQNSGGGGVWGWLAGDQIADDAIEQEAVVSRLMLDGGGQWDMEKVREVFDSMVAEAVLQIPLSRTNRSDSKTWALLNEAPKVKGDGKWEAPTWREMEVNVDASWSEQGRGGIGCVVRNFQAGRCLAAYAKRIPHINSVDLLEAYAFIEGLSCDTIIVEGDAKKVVDLITAEFIPSGNGSGRHQESNGELQQAQTELGS
ncbi:acyl-CoA-binding domain-containing protein 4 [Senna tora]|uniref:Acyl-CoA-binding domain-containing protein 4 n=1 Tax=Senna tora TaxID=362788 RepID=A0A834SJ22_9FABA|nr:acyl-CoA-binding domain-containing protein 4 [Senna tora]